MGGFEEVPGGSFLSSADIDTLAELNAILTDGTVLATRFTGTAGSIVFVGADTFLTEDNDKLFFDDASDELGINIGTDPLATLHIGRDLSTGDIFRVTHSGEDSTALPVYVGQGAAAGDFIITGDGRVGIDIDEATLNAKLRIKVDDAEVNIASALFIDQNDDGTIVALQIDHEGQGGNAVQINADQLTSGNLLELISDSSSVVSRELVRIVNDNTAATNANPLQIRNDAAGLLCQFLNLVSSVVFEVATTGHIKLLPLADGTETDVAPADDHTTKKLSIQKLASAPTNGAYIAFSNNPGAETFYLVMEEG